MIAAIISACRGALRQGDRAPSSEGAGLTRAGFLQLAAVSAATAGVGLGIGEAMAASRRAIPRVTDIDKLYDAWQSRFNAADLEGMVDLYVRDVTYINPQGKPMPGHAGVRADMAEAFALKPRIDIHDRKHLTYGDTVLTTNHWKLWMRGPDGKQQELTGGGIEVLRRQPDGAWRFIIDDASRSAS